MTEAWNQRKWRLSEGEARPMKDVRLVESRRVRLA